MLLAGLHFDGPDVSASPFLCGPIVRRYRTWCCRARLTRGSPLTVFFLGSKFCCNAVRPPSPPPPPHPLAVRTAARRTWCWCLLLQPTGPEQTFHRLFGLCILSSSMWYGNHFASTAHPHLRTVLPPVTCIVFLYTRGAPKPVFTPLDPGFFEQVFPGPRQPIL